MDLDSKCMLVNSPAIMTSLYFLNNHWRPHSVPILQGKIHSFLLSLIQTGGYTVRTHHYLPLPSHFPLPPTTTHLISNDYSQLPINHYPPLPNNTHHYPPLASQKTLLNITFQPFPTRTHHCPTLSTSYLMTTLNYIPIPITTHHYQPLSSKKHY